MLKKVLFFLFCSGLLLVIITAGLFFWQKSSPKVVVGFHQNDDSLVEVQAEIAKSEKELAKGLSQRKTLRENEAMLFVFQTEQFLAFWMKDVLFPLDIIFLNKDKQIVKIVEMAEPCLENCPSFFSDQPSQYVVEVQGGFCQQHNITEESKVEFIVPEI